MSVNWVSPVKERRVSVVGTKGAFVADLLSADLTFHENGDVPTEWDDISRLRGVTEGNRTTFAFPKKEPLVAELESFRDAVLGDSNAPVVTLADGVGVLEMAEELLGKAAEHHRLPIRYATEDTHRRRGQTRVCANRSPCARDRKSRGDHRRL